MDNIKIKKGKIRNHLFLQYEYQQTIGNVTNGHSTTSDAPIHQDLKESFRGLIPHFAFLCEEITEKKMKQFIDRKLNEEDELFTKFDVLSFSIGGSGDSEGVTITGNKQVESGIVNFSTPFTKWEDDYKFMDELIEAVDSARNEVLLYMEGKQAPKVQQEMNFEDFDTEEVFSDDDVESPIEEPHLEESIAAFKKATRGMKVTVSTSQELE